MKRAQRASRSAADAAVLAVGGDPDAIPARVKELWLGHFQGAPVPVVAHRQGLRSAQVEALFAEYELPLQRGHVLGNRGAAEVERNAALAVRVREMWILHHRCGVALDEVARRHDLRSDQLERLFEWAGLSQPR